MVLRDLELVRLTGAPLHFLHLTTRRSLELVSAARVAYLDTRAAIGCFTEIYEDNLPVRRSFAAWKASHDFWDCVSDPIRDINAD